MQDINQKLRDAEQVKSEFFANVSHELRTPLSLILSPLESILGGSYGQIAPEQLPLMQTLHNNSVRLLQMVNGLLDFAKFEAGKMPVKLEPTNVAVLIRSIFNDFSPVMESKEIGYFCTIHPKDSSVMIDRYLFERILFNLLSNAVKFTSAGGRVEVRCTVEDNRLRLSVSDTGIGISEADRENLFRKFSQLERSSTRRFEGTVGQPQAGKTRKVRRLEVKISQCLHVEGQLALHPLRIAQRIQDRQPHVGH